MRLSDEALRGERWAHLGYELIGRRGGRSHIRWTPGPALANPAGYVHGGYIGIVVDDTAGTAMSTLLPVYRPYPTVTLHVEFLRGLRIGETFECHGAVKRVGRQVSFAETSIYDATGQLMAEGQCTFAVDLSETDVPGFSAAAPPPADDLGHLERARGNVAATDPPE